MPPLAPPPATDLAQLRAELHQALAQDTLLICPGNIPTNADIKNPKSVQIARDLADRLGATAVPVRPKGPTLGAQFERHIRTYLERAYGLLAHHYRGEYSFPTNRRSIQNFDQYGHLADIDTIASTPGPIGLSIRTTFGQDYIVKPDIVMVRKPIPANLISAGNRADGTPLPVASPALARASGKHILHASISVKWTFRSDRAQNSRSEALNLIRNRKGRTPHIVAVTCEPLPSRLASIALGTGDIDCVYHVALEELRAIAAAHPWPDVRSRLATMVDGRRLRDIADLPLDLTL